MLGIVDVEQTLEMLLREYPSTFRMLRRAEYNAPNALTGYLRVEPGMAVKSDDADIVNHFTLGESSYCHNQMAYVLTTCMAQAGAFDGLAPLSLDVMNNKKFNQMVVTEYAVKFKKAFKSTEEFKAEFVVTDHRVRRSESGVYIFTRHEINFMDGKAFGSSRGAIKLELNELPNSRLGA